MPNSIVPSTFPAESRRRHGLPMRRKSLRSLSVTFCGIGLFDAAKANSPYVARRPELLCVTTPRSTEQLAAATFHLSAAALTIIARATAPAWRKTRHAPRVLAESPVTWRFKIGDA